MGQTYNVKNYYESEFQSHQASIDKVREACFDDFERWIDAAVLTLKKGGKIMFCGNGGSASDAQHLATELSVRYLKDRPAIAGLCLNTDTSTLTAAGNDYGFQYVFSRQIEAIGQADDLLVCISTSGNSQNLMEALKAAQKKKIKSVGLLGRDGGTMRDLCDLSVIVPLHETPRIQEMHITLGHIFCGALESALGLIE